MPVPKLSLGSTVRTWDGLQSYTPKQASLARKVFSSSARLAWSAASFNDIPKPNLPEITFLGSSNVGKSTLLNLLLNRTRNKLVRTSSKPGSTQTLKGFSIDDRVVLVDSPGYGYRSREEWGSLSMEYIKRRTSLKRVCLLVDGTKGISSNDEELIDMLCEKGVIFQVVLTKLDKLKSVESTKERLETTQSLLSKIGGAAVWPELIGVSSNSNGMRVGIEELKTCLYAACYPGSG